MAPVQSVAGGGPIRGGPFTFLGHSNFNQDLDRRTSEAAHLLKDDIKVVVFDPDSVELTLRCQHKFLVRLF